MFRSLLVPLDGSPESAAALPMARAIASATHGSITLMSVLSPAEAESGQAAIHLTRVADELRQANFAVEAIVRPGEPAHEIVCLARERKSDLIVMATHAPGRHAITSLSSIAPWVVAMGPAPVVLVPPGASTNAQLGSLLVPVDGSPGGSIALAAATALARATAARIALIEVVVPAPASAYATLSGMTLGGFIDPAWEAEAHRSAGAYVANMADHLRNAGIAADGHVAIGEIPDQVCLCASAVGADMIVMSTHAVRWPGDALVSSVADAVLRMGNRPVLLLRREHPAGDTEGDLHR